MVSADGLVKVLDFGLAKVTRTAEPGATQSMDLTSEGAVLGTPFYMSPEQAEGKAVDPRSDIFSFGVMLYEMATGRRPFTGDSQTAVLAAILRTDPQPLTAVRTGVPTELARVVARCLRKDPARRFQDMADLKVALLEVKEELEGAAPFGAGPDSAKPAGRKRGWIWVALAAAAIVIALAVWRFATPTQSQETALHPVPLTSYDGLEDESSFSPDGSQVAFAWNGEKEDNGDIYIKLIGPGAPLRLTTDSAIDHFPRWSLDRLRTPAAVLQRELLRLDCACAGRPRAPRRQLYQSRRRLASRLALSLLDAGFQGPHRIGGVNSRHAQRLAFGAVGRKAGETYQQSARRLLRRYPAHTVGRRP